jgi:hypothetical protein
MLKPLAKIVLAAAVTTAVSAHATDNNNDFNCNFADSTIRLDYVLGGNKANPNVTLAHTFKSKGWSGRQLNLNALPLGGNAQLTVTTLDGDTIYRTSFSTLYHEWLQLNDTVQRAYENSVLMPRPRKTVNVELKVLDYHHRTISMHRHVLNPADILIRELPATGYKTYTVHSGSYTGNKIHVAILPEGFTADEMEKFHEYARRTANSLFSHEPFGTLRDRFDIIAVDVPSKDSDVSVPKDGIWRNTAFGSHFSTFYSDRYLTTPNVFEVHNALAGVPYEHIIILANTNVYGGGGIYNSYTLTTTGNPKFEPVVVHEFGHSFGGLADEYFYNGDVMDDTYPTDVEPWEPNITTLVDFDSKWKKLIPKTTPTPTPVDKADKYPVGLYEGGGYSFKGIYRPADNCRMRINEIDHFCPACIDALDRLIKFYTE